MHFDGNILHRLIVFICFCRRDGIHHIQAFKDLPENGIGIAENIFQMCRTADLFIVLQNRIGEQLTEGIILPVRQGYAQLLAFVIVTASRSAVSASSTTSFACTIKN